MRSASKSNQPFWLSICTKIPYQQLFKPVPDAFRSTNMREPLFRILRYSHPLIFIVLALLQQIVIANANARVHSGDGVRSFESLTITQELKRSDVREIIPGAVIERTLSSGERDVLYHHIESEIWFSSTIA